MINMDKILDIAIEKDASDIHLIAENKPILRIMRQLQPIEEMAVLTVDDMNQMYDYLVNIKGLDPKRIIKEVSAMDTVENAKNTYKKLIEGNIKSITVITSEYHVRRGTLLFYGESLIYNEKNLTKPITIIKNAGYHTGNSPESKLMEGYSLALLMEVKIGLAIKEIIKDIFSFFFG